MRQEQLLEKINELLKSCDFSNALIAQELVRINFPEWYKILNLSGNTESYRYTDINKYLTLISEYGTISMKLLKGLDY